ncbi:MAG: CHAD domain-containing protein [Pseudomonadota bacterium]
MSFRIRPEKRANQQIRRLAGKRLARAAEALAQGSAEGVHDARKCLKQTRALLRLVHAPLGRKAFSDYNGQVRDIARQLSDQRDAAALVESWDVLNRLDPRRFADSPALRAVRERLCSRIPDEHQPGQSHGELRAQLDGLCVQAVHWRLAGKGFALFEAGVRRTYGDGRRALKVAQRQRSDDTLHQWRKRVKDHGYQTRLLQQAWPALFETRQASLDALADCLGQDHDLSVMQQLLAHQPALFGDPDTQARVAAGIAEHRDALYAEALLLGRRLYADKPGALVKRWRRLWRIAQQAAGQELSRVGA